MGGLQGTRTRVAIASAVAAAMLGHGVAHGSGGDGSTTPSPPAARARGDLARIEIRVERRRTGRQRLAIGGLAAGSAVASAAGLLLHLDSRSAALSISAPGGQGHTGRVYDSEIDATRRRALRSRGLALAAYAAGAALAVCSVAVAIVTSPGSDPVELGAPASGALVSIGVVPGGVAVAKAWRF